MGVDSNRPARGRRREASVVTGAGCCRVCPGLAVRLVRPVESEGRRPERLAHLHVRPSGEGGHRTVAARATEGVGTAVVSAAERGHRRLQGSGGPAGGGCESSRGTNLHGRSPRDDDLRLHGRPFGLPRHDGRRRRSSQGAAKPASFRARSSDSSSCNGAFRQGSAPQGNRSEDAGLADPGARRPARRSRYDLASGARCATEPLRVQVVRANRRSRGEDSRRRSRHRRR